QCIMPSRDMQGGFIFRFQFTIPDIDRTKSMSRTLMTSKLTCNHPDMPRLFIHFNPRNSCRSDRLITWCGHLVFGRQIDPELYHFKETAMFGKIWRMKFFMDYT